MKRGGLPSAQRGLGPAGLAASLASAVGWPRRLALNVGLCVVFALAFVVQEHSRGTRRWVIPKGWPMKGRTLPQSAAREALEEAGLDGLIGEEPIGFYNYQKLSRNGATEHLRVTVFAMQVTRQRKSWPEKAERVTRWMSVEDAAAAVDEAELKQILLQFSASLLASQMAANEI